MDGKVDISSTALEKAIDAARDFLDKLVMPATEEVGLLLRDSVALWKLKNQIRILNKARAHCEKHGIPIGTISLKLLCPLLDYAALEEDDTLQDKWAVLLANMVDSEQNVQNHVFPYILSQISTREFLFLEQVYLEKKRRTIEATADLEAFERDKPAEEVRIKAIIADFEERLETRSQSGAKRWGPDYWQATEQLRAGRDELRSLQEKEIDLTCEISRLEVVPYGELAGYEISNVVRLGLVKYFSQTSARAEPIEVPNDPRNEYIYAELSIELEHADDYLLTQLGEFFFAACSESAKARTNYEAE